MYFTVFGLIREKNYCVAMLQSEMHAYIIILIVCLLDTPAAPPQMQRKGVSGHGLRRRRQKGIELVIALYSYLLFGHRYRHSPLEHLMHR